MVSELLLCRKERSCIQNLEVASVDHSGLSAFQMRTPGLSIHALHHTRRFALGPVHMGLQPTVGET